MFVPTETFLILAFAGVVIIIMAFAAWQHLGEKERQIRERRRKIEEEREQRRLVDRRGEIGNKIAGTLSDAVKMFAPSSLRVSVIKDNAGCYYTSVNTSSDGTLFQISIGVHVVEEVSTFCICLHEGVYGKSAYFLPNEASVEWLIEELTERIRTR